MARIIAGMGTSHVPGVGAAMDNGKTHEDYWVELFKGFEPLRAWHAENVPTSLLSCSTITPPRCPESLLDLHDGCWRAVPAGG